MFECFGREKAVEGIAVMLGKPAGAFEAGVAKGEEFEAVFGEGVLEFFAHCVGEAEFAEADLDGDFPGRDRADQEPGVLTLDERCRGIRQLGRAVEKPEQGAGVEEEVHGRGYWGEKAPGVSPGALESAALSGCQSVCGLQQVKVVPQSLQRSRSWVRGLRRVEGGWLGLEGGGARRRCGRAW